MAKKKTDEKKTYANTKSASFRINERITVTVMVLINDDGEPVDALTSLIDNKTGKVINIK